MSGEVIRDVVINLRIKQIDAKLKVPDTKAVVGAVAAVNKEIEKTAKVQDDAASKFKMIQKSEREALKRRQQAEERLRKIREESARKVVEENIKAAESFKTLGDGIFTIARGSALLFTDTDKGMKEFVENVAIAQGAFDLFKGGVDVIKGLREGMVALNAASTAAATVNSAVAASNTAVATTGTAAAGSMSALTVAMGPLGIAIAAAGAATAGFIMLQKKSTKAAKEETKAQAEKEKQLKRSAEEKKKTQIDEIRRQSTSARSVFSAGSGSFREIQEIRQQAAAINDRNESSKRTIEIEKEIARRESEFNKLFLGNLHGRIDAKKAEAALNQRISQREKEIDEAVRRRDKARRLIEESSRRGSHFNIGDDADFGGGPLRQVWENIRRISEGGEVDRIRQLTANNAESAKLIAERDRQSVELMRDKVKFLRDAQSAQRELLSKAKEELATAKERVRTERERVESTEASLHRLDPRQKARLQAIAGKQRRGESLTDEELETLRSTGGSSRAIARFVQREQAKRGRGFAENVVSAFTPGTQRPADGIGPTVPSALRGPGSELSGFENAQRNAQNIFNQTQKKVQQTIMSLEKKEDATLKALETVIERAGSTEKRIRQLEARLDENDLAN